MRDDSRAGLSAGKAHLITLGAFLCFGLMSPLCKWAMESGQVSGVAMAGFRLCGASLLFWLISPLVARQRVARGDWWPLIIMSLCGMGINQFCYVRGVQYTSPTNACVIGETANINTLSAFSFVKHFQNQPKNTKEK
jgi:drug/metabolite transporter (DMT)-like permease